MGALPPGRRGAVGLNAPPGTAERGWDVQRWVGAAYEHFQRPWPEPVSRSVRVLEVDNPAVVLGSTQPDTVVARGRSASLGVAVVRRQSGGGAVLLHPGQVLWTDVFIPTDDVVWDDDVGRAAHWLGDAWASALRDAGIEASPHTGGVIRGPFSDLACFAGLGPGEVTVAGKKVVGISQRRTRRGALFQCAAILSWDPTALGRLLKMADRERSELAERLQQAAGPVPVERDHLERALLHRLP